MSLGGFYQHDKLSLGWRLAPWQWGLGFYVLIGTRAMMMEFNFLLLTVTIFWGIFCLDIPAAKPPETPA